MRLALNLHQKDGLKLLAGILVGAFLYGVPSGFAEGLAAHAPVSKPPLYTAGVKAYRQGDYADALHCFRQVLNQDGDNVNAHYYLALSKDNLGQGLDAVPDYRFVVSHGTEPSIVDYAKTRLNAIHPVPAAKAGDVALIASGSPALPVIYRGVASQVAVPLKNSKNALIVDAFINQGRNQVDGVFIIDTGATYTSISRDMADKLGLDLTHCETVFITTANGRIEVPKVTLQKLNVNGLEAYNVEATVIPLRKESSFAGLLGLSFIRQFVLTIDPQANQLIFRKN
jgi:clan AA aspartic protease (TIGR02281 family)